jgi:hypothetical protein
MDEGNIVGFIGGVDTGDGKARRDGNMHMQEGWVNMGHMHDNSSV